jgi:hypothetical protein
MLAASHCEIMILSTPQWREQIIGAKRSAHDLGYRAQFVQNIVYNPIAISGTNSV